MQNSVRNYESFETATLIGTSEELRCFLSDYQSLYRLLQCFLSTSEKGYRALRGILETCIYTVESVSTFTAIQLGESESSMY